jgi:hypothetical protein
METEKVRETEVGAAGRERTLATDFTHFIISGPCLD